MDLCSVQAFVIYQDGALGSREQAIKLADKTMAIAQRLGHLGATFLLLLYAAREAVTLADLESLETLEPAFSKMSPRPPIHQDLRKRRNSVRCGPES